MGGKAGGRNETCWWDQRRWLPLVDQLLLLLACTKHHERHRSNSGLQLTAEFELVPLIRPLRALRQQNINDEEDEDQEAAEEMGILRLENCFPLT